MKERILCSAIWYEDAELKHPEILRIEGFSPTNTDKGVVICGWRHHNCIAVMNALTGKRLHGNREEGFLTSKNRFVDRIEGAKIALKSGQINELKYGKQLYSEDLW